MTEVELRFLPSRYMVFRNTRRRLYEECKHFRHNIGEMDNKQIDLNLRNKGFIFRLREVLIKGFTNILLPFHNHLFNTLQL